MALDIGLKLSRQAKINIRAIRSPTNGCSRFSGVCIHTRLFVRYLFTLIGFHHHPLLILNLNVVLATQGGSSTTPIRFQKAVNVLGGVL